VYPFLFSCCIAMFLSLFKEDIVADIKREGCRKLTVCDNVIGFFCQLT